MEVTITWQTVATIVAVIASFVALYKYFRDFVHTMDKLKKIEDNNKEIKEELSILTAGLLACLKGLSEQGCDGPVTKAISDIEKYLTEKAHK